MPDANIMVQIRAREEQRPWAALDALTGAGDMTTREDLAAFLRDALGSLVDDWRATAELYEKAKLKGAMTTYVVPLRHAAAELDKVIKGLVQPRRAPLGQLQFPAPEPHESAELDEPVHRFVPDGDRRSCDVVTDGLGCGRFASHPVHRLQAPAIGDGAGLDALIADSVAKHKQLDAEGVPDFRGPGDLADSSVGSALVEATRDEIAAIQAANPIARIASAPDFPGQASSEEVTAYLRGETDDLPGEPLRPSSVRDQTAPEQIEFKMTPKEAAAWRRGEVDPESEVAAYLRDVVGEVPEHDLGVFGVDERAGVFPPPLDAWAMTSARQTLETSPVTMPPVPLLGQPGNAGAGYDHAYVPPGGVPASYAELMTPVPPAALPAHISHSQIETAGDCSVKYRLQRLPRLGANNPSGMAETEQIPQWALIGGNALHAAIEKCERIWAANPGDPFDVVTADEESGRIWSEAFDAECQKIEATSPVPRSRWRASRSGAEGETWWNANGPLMIERYLKARPAEPTVPHIRGVTGPPAIEAEIIVDVPTPYGPITYKAVIDRVTVRADPGTGETTLIIRDYKSGYSMPDSTQQLGEYAQVLRLLGVPPSVKILGSYFNARKGTWTPEVDLEAGGWTAEWFAYHVASGHAERLKLTMGPTPARPSSFCGGCSVRWACPVKNGARR